MLKCKNCGKELTKKQKSTCSRECRNEYVRKLNIGRTSPFKGKKRWTEEQRKKIGDAQRGKPKSEEFRKKCSERMKGVAFFKGHKHTEQYKKEMSQLMKKLKPWEKSIAKRTKHGEGRTGKQTAEYRIWVTMKQRCSNKKTRGYKNYGGRGITVCERWKESYNNFLEDMGRRPTEKHSIDRINNDGNYEPNNCRWATQKEQYENSRLHRCSNGQFI